MSGGQITINELGIKDYIYYASEINPYSIKITQKNYPNTIQLGDVVKLRRFLEAGNVVLEKLANKNNKYAKFVLDIKINGIDWLIAGSPCTNLTITVCNNYEHNQGLEGEESKLFFEFVKIKKILKPKKFMLENVASMSEENKNIISDYLGCEPIPIDANIFSAQDRARYYWTDMEVGDLPKDQGVVLKDIMESNVDEKYYYNKPFEFHGWDKKVIATLDLKCHDIGKRVYNPNMKCATLTGVRGGYQEKKVYDDGRCRKLIPIEYERLQQVPENYTEGVADSKRYTMLGDGWNIGSIKHIMKNEAKKYI